VTRAVTGDGALVAVLLSNVAFVAALFVVLSLGRLVVTEQQALLGAVFLALAAGGTAFSMAYTDSLFLLLAVGTLLAAERGSRPLAGLLGLLAGLTRLQGALLCLPLIVLFALADGRRPRLSWLWALGPPAGLVAFCVGLAQVTGDFFSPIAAQKTWDFGTVPGAVTPTWVLVIAALIYGPTVGVGLWLGYRRWRDGHDQVGVAWYVANVGAIVFARRLASLPRYLAPVPQLAEQLMDGHADGRHRRSVVVAILVGAALGCLVLSGLAFGLQLPP
jgi:hypothetical protein